MALARVLHTITFLIYIQGSRGQFNSLINTNPLLGQNNQNQGFQNANIKAVTDNLYQNENLGKNTNFISQKQMNSQQPSIPQSLPIHFPLQQSQNSPQLINQKSQQSPQTPDLQSIVFQPQSLFMQQPSILQQQPHNVLETPPAFIPNINAGSNNYQQQGGTPPIQQVPIQISQPVPLSNSYVPNYSSLSSTGGDQRMEFVTNLNGNYLVPINALPFSASDGQITTSIPTLPYTTIFPPFNPMIGNNLAVPLQNKIFGNLENPFDVKEFVLSDDVTALESDKLITLLMSLLKSPKKIPKYLQSAYQENLYEPYTPYKISKHTKSSSLKALLPIILNLIKERREGCGCSSGCKCYRKNRNKKDYESPSIEDYLRKEEYNLKDEIYRANEFDEETPRITREHKNCQKPENPPDSIESSETDDMDYDNLSEEEED